MGINPEFFAQEDEPTGALARLICDDKTTELTHVAAGNTYSKQRHLDLGECAKKFRLSRWCLIDQC